MGGEGPPRRGIAGFVGSVGRRAGSAGGSGHAERRDDSGTHVGGQVGPRRHEADQVGVGRGVGDPGVRPRRGRDSASGVASRWPPSCASFRPRCGPRCAWRCAPVGIGVFSRSFRECTGVRFPPAPFLEVARSAAAIPCAARGIPSRHCGPSRPDGPVRRAGSCWWPGSPRQVSARERRAAGNHP